MADWVDAFAFRTSLPAGGRYTLGEVIATYSENRAVGDGSIMLLPADGPFEVIMPGGVVVTKSDIQILHIKNGTVVHSYRGR